MTIVSIYSNKRHRYKTIMGIYQHKTSPIC